MRKSGLIIPLLGLLLTAWSSVSIADPLSELPPQWQQELIPIEEADISGAERLMQESVAESRREVATLLTASEPDRETLAGAYGRLGALTLLLEMEAQADACFRDAHKLQPREFRWPYYAGYLAMMSGRTERALEYLEAARAIDGDYPTLYLRLGKVQMDRSELADARAALERISDTPGLVTAANYYLGQIANLERRHDDAIAHLEKALAADPDATEVHYPLAQAYRALGKNDLARDHLSRFQLKTPEARDPLLEQLQGATKRSLPAFQKALHATRQGDWAAGADLFAQGLAIDPDNVPARVSHARALFLSGHADKARAELSKALEAEPEELLANFLMGVLLQQQGLTKEAADHYKRTLEIDPGHAGALFYLANLDFRAGRYDQAAPGYAKARAAEREIAPARLLELIARLHAGEAEAKIARRLMDLSAEYPDDPMPRYALARLLAVAQDPGLRNPEKALQIASALALLQPIPPHLRLLALTQAAGGRFDEAIETQKQAIAMSAWTTAPQEQARMHAELQAYQRSELPQPAWPPDDPLLSPPLFDPVAPFRDYPAAVPY
jgi:tetratricopeptide (TPR) repeat protein